MSRFIVIIDRTVEPAEYLVADTDERERKVLCHATDADAHQIVEALNFHHDLAVAPRADS